MGTIRAGRLDRRITVRRQGPATDDGYTTLPGVLADYYTCFASWKPARGRETFENLGREAYSGGTFWVRHNPTSAAIKTTDKVSYGGLSWDIISIQEVGRREGVELTVVAGEADDLEPADEPGGDFLPPQYLLLLFEDF